MSLSFRCSALVSQFRPKSETQRWLCQPSRSSKPRSAATIRAQSASSSFNS